MNTSEVFLYSDLTPVDQVCFAKLFQVCLASLGPECCWCTTKIEAAAFYGFSSAHPRTILYKTLDARPFLLAIAGEFQTEMKAVAVRKSICKSIYCLNPSHYYWGTRVDVACETAKKKPRQKRFDPVIIENMRQDKESNISILKISRKYKIPYHITRRICNGETYTELTIKEVELDSSQYWTKVMKSCSEILESHPKAVKEFNVSYHMTNELECPWYHKGDPKHKGNFGLMGECLDCMEEIKNGRCTVDVTNFDINWYWTVKRFWDQVDIRGEDECWPWIGPTKKGKQESVAYMPSPFHSGKSQSAPRVAFWVSRGYTGKYRVFSQISCKAFCCNPKHLTIRELKGHTRPKKIETINLSYGNIFDQYRQSLAQSKADLED